MAANNNPMSKVLLIDMDSHSRLTDSPRTNSPINRFWENIGMAIIQVSGFIGLTMKIKLGIIGIMKTRPMYDWASRRLFASAASVVNIAAAKITTGVTASNIPPIA